MSGTFAASLVGVVALALVLRVSLPRLPLASVARRLSLLDALIVVIGVLGLVLHCGAMFYADLFSHLPLSEGLISRVRSMGTSSVILYVIPAGLVLLGLRRQHPAGLLLLAIALLAVGVTMYDGSALRTHLGAIFVSVTVLSGLVATSVLAPRRVGSSH